MRLIHYSTGTDGLWVGLSDHRSILVNFSPLRLAQLQATPRFNKEFGDLKRLQIKRPHLNSRSSTRNFKLPGAHSLRLRSVQPRPNTNLII